MRVVDQDRHGLLVGYGMEERGQRVGHLRHIGRLERLYPGSELRDEPRENAQSEMVGGRDTGRLKQTAAHERAQRAPGRVVVALQDPRRRHLGAGEGESVRAGVEQSGAPGAWLTGNHQARRALARHALELREQARVGVTPADEGRLAVGVASVVARPLVLADAGGQRRQVRTRPPAEVALQPLRELLIQHHAACGIALERGAAHREREGHLAVGIER